MGAESKWWWLTYRRMLEEEKLKLSEAATRRYTCDRREGPALTGPCGEFF